MKSDTKSMRLLGSVRVPLVAMLVLGSAWFGAVPAAACPGCRTQGDLVELEEPETVTASLALSWSVLFLLAVLGGVGGFLGVYIRNAVARVDEANSRR
jgi:hypothetical protein